MSLLNSTSDCIYITPWNNEWDEYRQYEYRTFIHDRKLTAVSQYHWPLAIDHKDITRHAELIVDFITNKIMPKVDWIDSFVADVIVINSERVDLIELNTFGKEQASGSCCFHWLNDYDKMYNGGNDIYVRYTCDDIDIR